MAQTAGITGDDTIDQCETGISYTVSMQNDSGNPLTDLVVTAQFGDLPGFSYVSGTTNINVDGGAAFCTANPTLSGTDLVWDIDAQCGGPFTLNDGHTLNVTFSLETNCTAVSGSLRARIDYEINETPSSANSVLDITVREPVINITKTRADQPIGCGELVEWTITVQNMSGYTLPIIWVEDTLDAAFTYSSSVGDPPYTSDDGTFDGVNTVSWELRNVNHNDTVTLTLRATSDSPPCSPDLDNTVRAWSGCGAADGSSATKPGEDPPDDDLCLTTSSVSAVRTETREPAIRFLDIALNPTSINSCNGSTEVSVTIQNTGPTDASNVDLVVTLPAGITYINNTSAVTCGGVLTDPAPEPVVSGNQLIYYNVSNTASNLCDLVQASGGNDTATLTFSVRSNCSVTGDVGFRLYYYDCCGDTQYYTTTSETLTSLYPALSITKTPQNSQVDCGENQTWTITATNNGTGNAQVVRIEDTLGDWIDYVSSSPAATLMGGQTYGWEINNLASGSSQSFDITGQLNPDAPQNDCSALLRQDNARAIWGCGTAGDAVDNDPTTTDYDCTHTTWANAPAATLQMPDLVVTAITPVISSTSDGVFSGAISVAVRNQGDGVASGGFQVSVDDGNGWTGTGSYSSDLAAGAEATVSIDVTGWSPDCTPCTYNFNATVDVGDTVCECREDNNNFGPQAYSPAIPDLEVDSDTLAITCAADGQCRVLGTVTLRNDGCAGTITQDVPMQFTLSSGAGCSGTQVAQWTQMFTGVNIPAGGTQVFIITNYDVIGNACTSATGCQLSIRTEADYTNTIYECDGGNNTLCSDKTFTIPDLRVVSDTLAISCSVDGQCRIQGNLVVANDGCGANFVTNIPIRIRLYNNNATCSGTNGNLVFTQAGVNIPAGGTQTFAINRTLTRNLCTNSTGCQVALGVELDYTSTICECANTNNAYCSPNKTISIPDLQVTGDTLGVTCLQDGQVRVSGDVTIANTGCNAAVVGNLPVRFTLFSNINCGGAQLAQWTETFAGANITAGSSQVFNITNRDIIANICTSSTGGQVSLRIEADPAPGTICECYGGNNARCSNKPLSVPDLRITAVTPSITCISDGNLSGAVQVTVNNNGYGAANNIPVRLTSDCGHTFTDQTIASLAAGASTTLIFSFTPNTSACNCTFTAAADPDNVVCECDGTNNSLAAAPHTSPVPDLTITDIDFSNVTWANDTVAGSVIVTVNNQGCGTANNFQVSLSTDGCLDFTNQTVVSLAAGASTNLTFNISGSWADCTDGSCQFTAAVDPADAVCEYDGTNNTRSETYNSTLPDLVVTDIDFSGITCVNDNVSGSVAVTINNQGFSNAANFQVSLATDGYLSFTNQTVANLAAGASTAVAFNVSGSCTDCADCTLQFTATVDPTNTVSECSGANNTRAETFTSTLPDLTVNSVIPSVTGLSDGNLQGTVTVNVSNMGCGNANNAMVRLTSSCGYVFADQTVNLAAGANANLVFTYTPTCPNCSCTFAAVVDPDATVCEGDGTNNALTSAPFTMTVPDIQVQANTLTATCSGDGQCAIAGTVTLVNNGCGANLTADVPMRFTLLDNTGCSGNQLSQWTQTFTGVNLASGGGTQVFTVTPQTIAADLCSNSTNCQVSIRVEADYSDSIYECDGTDNTFCADNKSVDIPTLEVQSDTLGVSCTDDGQVTVSGAITLSNNGCGSNLASDIPMRFTLFDNTGGSGNQLAQWTESFTGVNIASGGGTQVFTITPQTLVADLCANSTNCQVSIRVEPDYDHSICECDGTDHTYLTDKSISIPDLTVNSVTPSVISGTVTVNVSNIGCDTASGAAVRLVSDCGISFTDQTVDLAASSSRDIVFNFTPPALPYGCRFTAIVDPDSALCECRGANNAASGAFSGLSIVKSVAPTTNVAYHGIVTYTIVLTNTGTVSDTNVLLTDTLPTAVEFGSWLEQPAGTVRAGRAITWTGMLTNNTAITFAFTAIHTGDFADVVTNTAHFTGMTPAGSDEAVFTVRVNNPPIANAGPDQTVNAAASVTLDGSASSDPDGHLPLGYGWTQTGGPPVSLSSATAVSPTFTAPITPTVLTFTLAVTDSFGLADPTPDTVAITVSNRAPIANAGPDQMVNTAAGVTLDGSASSDPDDHLPLGYGWTQTGGSPVSLSSATAVSPTFTAPITPTVLTFTLAVTDSFGLADPTPDTVAITVIGLADLSIFKSVAPTTNVAYHGIVTYTVVLSNTGTASDTNVLFTDTLPASVTFGQWLERPAGTVRVGNAITWTGTLTNSAAITFTFTTTHTGGYGDVVTNTAHFSGTAQAGRDEATFAVEPGPTAGTVYLPLVWKGFVSAPDLVVEGLVATSSAVTVTIRNRGNAPATDAFWVDVYFNPTETPSVNKPWNTIASHGAAWGVTTHIPAGDVLVLTTGGDYYFLEYSSTPPLPVGANVYALVDSINSDTTYGAVQESNEGNNLFGPVVSTAATG